MNSKAEPHDSYCALMVDEEPRLLAVERIIAADSLATGLPCIATSIERDSESNPITAPSICVG